MNVSISCREKHVKALSLVNGQFNEKIEARGGTSAAQAGPLERGVFIYSEAKLHG